jgi:magnesium-transporting ATPase (P-type)
VAAITSVRLAAFTGIRSNLKYAEGPIVFAIIIAIFITIVLYLYFRKYEKNNAELQKGLDVVKSDTYRFVQLALCVVFGAFSIILLSKLVYSMFMQ